VATGNHSILANYTQTNIAFYFISGAHRVFDREADGPQTLLQEAQMNATPRTVSPLDVYQQLGRDAQAILIDVRTAAEYQAMHAHGARLVPLDEFDADRVMSSLEGSRLGRDKPIYITCHSGRRAARAAERLAERGYHNVAVVQGGCKPGHRPVCRWCAADK
jgi:rhodanese-related sulfurtransferase